MAVSVEQWCEEVRKYVGVPYRHQGRNQYGLDCVGLVVFCMDNLGILPEGYKAPHNYGYNVTQKLIEHIADWCEPTDVLEPGTMLSIRYAKHLPTTHVLLYMGGKHNTFVHSTGVGVRKGVQEVRYGEPWVRRTTGIWRLPGIHSSV